MSEPHYYEVEDIDFCPVCGSTTHFHCSRGCFACDDTNAPVPRYASTFCTKCKQSFCVSCMEKHKCGGIQ